jgi:hypothetical protein
MPTTTARTTTDIRASFGSSSTVADGYVISLTVGVKR